MIKIDLTDFDEAYQILEQSFIPSELRPYDYMKLLFMNNEFSIYAYKYEHKILSVMIVWEFDRYVYVENFATKEHMRGQGIGTKMLQYLKEIYSKQIIVLEVEPPLTDYEIKRIEFYKRNEFCFNDFHYVQPVLRPNYPQVNLHLMSYPYQLNNNQTKEIKNILFKNVYKVK